MSTYATYFHFTPSSTTTTMVYPNPRQSAGLTSSYPPLMLKLQPQEPRLSAPETQDSDIVMSDGECESIPKGRAINQQTESLWFRLPAEIRNQIYTDLLCPETPRLKDLAHPSEDLSVKGFNQTTTKAELYPEILSTCKKIYDEAVGMLYGTHVFHAHPSLLASLPHLTSAAKPVLHQSVTSMINRWQITLRLDIDPRFTFEQATKAFSNAEYLEIRVWQAQFEACDYSVLKLFTGIRGVQVARVGGSVDPELAKWLEETMMQPQENHKEGDICGCVNAKCPGFEGRQEIVCGRCYRKVGVEWIEKEWDLWRFTQ